MTRDAAVGGAVVALALGFYVARWFQAENDDDAASRAALSKALNRNLSKATARLSKLPGDRHSQNS